MKDTPPVIRPTPLGRGVVLVTGASGAFVLSSYAVNVWLGRLLGPEDYGRFAVVVTIMTLVNVAQNSSVPQAMARIVARNPSGASAELRAGLLLQITLGVVLGTILFTTAPLIARLLGDRFLEGPLRTAALVVPPYGVFALSVAYQNGLGRYGRQATGQIAYAIGKAVGSIGLAYQLRAAGGVLGYGLAAVVGTAVLLARPSGGPRRSTAMEMIAFGGPHALYSLLTMGQFSIDIVFVTALGDASAVGAYAAGQSIARIPYFLLAGLAIVILPAVARGVHSDAVAATSTVRRALRLAILTVFPLSAVLVGVSEGLLHLLFGSRYLAGAPVLAILCIGMAALAVGSVAGAALSGVGQPSRAAAIGALGLAITVVGSILLVPAIGPAGAALAMTAGALASLGLMLLRLSETLPGAVPVVTLARGSAVGALAGMALLIISPDGPGLVLAAGTAVALAFGSLIAAGELGREDIEQLGTILRRSRKH